MNEEKNSKQVLIDYATHLSRNDLANFLEKIAVKIRDEGSFTFVQNETEIDINFPKTLKTEIEYEIEKEKHEFKIEIEWREGQTDSKINIL